MDLNNDYDPYVERLPLIKRPIRSWEAFMHVLKGCFGTGVLVLPLAFKEFGYGYGLIFTIAISVMSFYAIRVVVKDMYLLCKSSRKPYLPFPEAMQYAFMIGHPKLRWFAKAAGIMARCFLAVKHFGTCSVYTLFAAENLKMVVDRHTPVDTHLNFRIYIAILFVPLVALFSIRYLKMLTPISIIANVLLITGYGFVMYYICEGLPYFEPLVGFKYFLFIPRFYGTVLFAATSVGVMLAVEGEMKNPKAFLSKFGVCNSACFCITTFYCIFAFLGYWRYKEELMLAINMHIGLSGVTDAVRIMFAIAVFLSFAIQAYVSHNIIWPFWIKPHFHPDRADKWEYLFRFIFVTFAVGFAVGVPLLNDLMSFLGALCVSFLLLIFPAMMNLCVKYNTGYGKIYIYFIRDVFAILLGMFGAITGMWFSMDAIVRKIQMG